MEPFRFIFADLLYTGFFAWVIITGIICACGGVYFALDARPEDHLSYLQSLFFMYDNFTRAGYGNYFPQTTSGRVYMCFLLIFGVPVYTFIVIYTVQALLHIILLKRWVRMLNFLFPCCRGSRFTNRQKPWPEGLLVAFFCFCLSMIFSGVFVATEGWGYGDSMYFIITSITTVAYGDIYPTTTVGQSVWFIFAAFGLSLYAVVLGIFSNGIMEFLSKRRARVKEQLKAKRMVDHENADDPPPPADITAFDEPSPDLPPYDLPPFSNIPPPIH